MSCCLCFRSFSSASAEALLCLLREFHGPFTLVGHFYWIGSQSSQVTATGSTGKDKFLGKFSVFSASCQTLSLPSSLPPTPTMERAGKCATLETSAIVSIVRKGKEATSVFPLKTHTQNSTLDLYQLESLFLSHVYTTRTKYLGLESA